MNSRIEEWCDKHLVRIKTSPYKSWDMLWTSNAKQRYYKLRIMATDNAYEMVLLVGDLCCGDIESKYQGINLGRVDVHAIWNMYNWIEWQRYEHEEVKE